MSADTVSECYIHEERVEHTGFRPPFRFGGEGIWFVGDSIENSELARILDAMEKEEFIISALVSLSRLAMQLSGYSYIRRKRGRFDSTEKNIRKLAVIGHRHR
jgi:hypothetical protein